MRDHKWFWLLVAILWILSTFLSSRDPKHFGRTYQEALNQTLRTAYKR
jgi:hypothetical protein